MSSSPIQATRIPLSIYMIALAQGIGLSCAVIAVTVAPLAGSSMTELQHLASFAFGLQFVAMIPASFISSTLMKRYGRKPVILLACGCGIAAGIIGALATINASLVLLCLTHILLGIFLSNIQLLRFAALDMSPKKLHAQVIPLVLLGGVLAALLGPTLARQADKILPLTGYSAIYLMISLLASCALAIIIFIPFSKVKPQPLDKAQHIKASAIITNSGFLFAAFCGGAGYFLMSLLMVSSTIFLQHSALELHFSTISLLIQAHVLAMYLPALVATQLLKAIGVWNFLILGIVLQIGSNITAIIGGNTYIYLLSLILLGVAWNFLYTSGTWIQGALFSGDEKFKAQGLNDMTIALLTAISTLGAASLLVIFGWNTLNIFSMILSLAMFVYALAMRQRVIAICADK